MIIDHDLIMADKQAVTSSAAGAKVLDLGKGGDAEKQLYFIVDCNEKAEASGDTTVKVELQTSDTADFATYKTVAASGEIAKSVLTEEKQIFVGRISNGVKQYLRAYFTVGANALTAGKFSAYLAMTAHTNN